MRLWCLHVDDCEFAAEQPRPDVEAETLAESAPEDPDSPDNAASSEGAIESGVVALVGVEQRDETAPRAGDTTATRLAAAAHERIDETATDLGESAVVIIPSPALASTPASDKIPTKVFDQLDGKFEQGNREYLRAPVGWHLSVDLSARGHPYASRVHDVTGTRVGDASDWQVIADGSVTDADEADLPARDERYLDRRRNGDRDEKIDLTPAREAGLVADEDSTVTPAGTLVRDLLGERLDELFRATGARPVDTLRATVESASDTRQTPPFDPVDGLSADDLPLSLYTMDGRRAGPETWTVVPDYAEGVDAVETQVALLRQWLADAGLEFVPAITVSDSVNESATGCLGSLAGAIGRPTLFERRVDGPPLTVEMAVIDSEGRTLGTARVRLKESRDAGNADAPRNADKPRMTVHTTVDELDRFLVALCASDDDRRFPTWLAPAQARMVPLDPSAHLARSQAVADALADEGVRADVDDRSLPVSERIESAEAAGTPYFSLVGNSEVSGETIPVTDRRARSEREWTPAELAAAVTDATEGLPKKGGYQPQKLSERLFSSVPERT